MRAHERVLAAKTTRTRRQNVWQGIPVPRPHMSDAPDPDEVLDELEIDLTDDDEEEENTEANCLYLDRAEPAYLWAAEDDDTYVYLEQTRSGSWLPRGRPITATEAEYHLSEVLDEDSTDTYEVRPQTALPPGRHRRDQE